MVDLVLPQQGGKEFETFAQKADTLSDSPGDYLIG